MYKGLGTRLCMNIGHTNGIVIVLIAMSGKHSPNVSEALCIGTSLVTMTALSR